MSRKWLFWATVGVLAIYLGISPFQDLNGRLFRLPLGSSKALTYGLVLCGIILSILTLTCDPKRWVVPTISLIIFVFFFF